VPETARYADELGVPVDGLVDEVTRLHSGAGAIDAVRRECEAFGITPSVSAFGPLEDPFFTARRGRGADSSDVRSPRPLSFAPRRRSARDRRKNE
jgi:hypothetical protein